MNEIVSNVCYNRILNKFNIVTLILNKNYVHNETTKFLFYVVVFIYD